MRLLTAALTTVLGLSLMSAGPTFAADDELKITDGSRVIEVTTPDEVAGLAREIGGQNVTIENVDDGKSVMFKDGDLNYALGFICDKDKPADCYGVTMLAIIENGSYPYEILNKWNRDTTLLTLFKNEGKIAVARVEILDGGVTRKHLAGMIAWFAVEFRTMMENFESELTAGVQIEGALKPTNLATAPRTAKPTAAEVARLTKALAARHAKRLR